MTNAVRLPRTLTFRRLHVAPGVYDPALRAAMHGRSGVYVLRRVGRTRAEYVGESHTGRAWKTMLRHLQAVESFRARGEWAPCACPARYEVAWIPTRADQAQKVEARAIRRYRPRANLVMEAARIAKEIGF